MQQSPTCHPDDCKEEGSPAWALASARRKPRQARQLLAALAVLVMGLAACSQEPAFDGSLDDLRGTTLFTQVPSTYSGIDFVNPIRNTQDFNVFSYRNFYEGGGVAMGDLNGDGLPDLYFVANAEPNRLYLNRGDFRFEDITRDAGVEGDREWSTGVAMADVDGNGWLDLYVLAAGPGEERQNELFLNDGPDSDGIPQFREAAAEFGLADNGYGTHAAFFDYDKDGDLDVYVMNNTSRAISDFDGDLARKRIPELREQRHPDGGDKFYRNDNGNFVEVGAEVGIEAGEFGFGLSVTVSDVNRDGWPDLYVANDFFERDFLYLNNGDGTFTDRIKEQMPIISQSSMGSDIADLNGDGFPEVYVVDMLPADDRRLKTTSRFDGWNGYQNAIDNDLHHQLMRNTLQLNHGDGTFSEISFLAGVAATDWSWAPLIADFDLDGHPDIYVTNGIAHDITDQDFVTFFNTEAKIARWIQENGLDYEKLADMMPSTPLPNYAFRHTGDALIRYEDASTDWGLATPGFSKGAAYGDLDADGDLDLVVNNVNGPAFVYRNEADTLRADQAWLQVALDGEAKNTRGLGAQVTLRVDGQTHYQELVLSRGFQSSVDDVLAFGLGAATQVDSLIVRWPDDRVEIRTEVPVNQRLRLVQSEATAQPDPSLPSRSTPAPLFTDVTTASGLDATHIENAFVDFNRGEGLLPKMLSTEGPRMAVGDVNGDGLDDVYLGGAKEQPGRLFVQQRGGGFAVTNAETFRFDAISEDVDATFLDADGDRDLDLYVASGGSEYGNISPALQDRLYLNDGRGGFSKAEGRLPANLISTGAVAAHDYDGDGDTDLFVGGRLIPWKYGLTPRSLLLQNDGRGIFTDVTETAAPDLSDLGLITDATWADADGDGRADLVIAGEWLPITIFRTTPDGLVRLNAPGLEQSHGLWNRVHATDLDGDGDTDFLAGNLGLNTSLRASVEEPLTMHVMDFDRNNYAEQIISQYENGRPIAQVMLGDLTAQLPMLEGRFETHQAFAEQPVDAIFTADELADATVRTAHTLATSFIENLGDGSFAVRPLPREAQRAPVYGFHTADYNGDGHTDIVLGGNFFAARPQLGSMLASYGLLLTGDGAGGFTPVSARKSGLRLMGQVRDMQPLRTPRGMRLVIAKNYGPVQVVAKSL